MHFPFFAVEIETSYWTETTTGKNWEVVKKAS